MKVQPLLKDGSTRRDLVACVTEALLRCFSSRKTSGLSLRFHVPITPGNLRVHPRTSGRNPSKGLFGVDLRQHRHVFYPPGASKRSLELAPVLRQSIPARGRFERVPAVPSSCKPHNFGLDSNAKVSLGD